MDAVLSAVATDLVGRLVSFLVRKYQERGAAGGVDAAVRLQRALLRAGAVVEDAEGRQIANLAMLLQLNQLRGEMCRGAYVLDAFTRRAVERGRRRSHCAAASRSLGLPPGSDATAGAGEGLSVAVDNLEAMLSDMTEFVVLLGACPRVARQPYSVYLYMESCMFGRQMEKEQIVGFLLQPSQDLEVLPVIGPHEIGKRTLVEHACLEERIREKFGTIHYLNSDDLMLPSHEHHRGRISTAAERSLFVVDLAGGDVDEEERCRRFRASLLRHGGAHHQESKMIVISRTERPSGLGTVPPLRLRAPRREELWYFFRALAFGGADPEERPELLRVAMALFAGIHDPALFAAAGVVAASLSADLSARSWRRVMSVFGGATSERGVYLCRPVKDSPGIPCSFYGRRKSTGAARSELPDVTDLVTGRAVLPVGETRFDVVVWQSRIPPYVSYIATCDTDMERARQVAAVEKPVHHKRARG